jgi:hypothetical protein
MKKDLNYIAALEKAISEKYGDRAIHHPKADWTPEKEVEYLEQSKEAYAKELANRRSSEVVENDGVLVTKKLISKTINRSCQYCNKYSFKNRDDVYLVKFNCCELCYLDRNEGK